MRLPIFLILLASVSVLPLHVSAAEQNDHPGLIERDQKYRLQPSDVLEVEYSYTPEYNQTATVQPDGEVTLKVLGGVKVAGLTVEEARSHITEMASKHLNQPEITLLLKEYVKPHFTVSGEVNKPGSYDLHGATSVVEAIAMSGGFKESSKQTQVVLVRKMNADVAEVRMLDFKELTSPRGIREDIAIKPGDMLIVPKNRLSKVEPYIRVAALAMGGMYGVALFAK